jgi:predicted DCC family thiol-disulfide oxidoreductase YuxK
MTPSLTLYFDGLCPFCVKSMHKLMAWNTAGHLAFVDIARPGFDPSALGVDMAALNRELHAETPDGQVLVGIDSMLAAYTLVGRGWRVSPLRVRLLRPALAASYRWFARHRYGISKRLGYRLPPACDGDTCSIGNPFMKRQG